MERNQGLGSLAGWLRMIAITVQRRSRFIGPLPPRVVALGSCLLLMLWLWAAPVSAAIITVSGDCSLAEAIENANDGEQTNSACGTGSSGADIINLRGNVTLAATAEALTITSSLTINGGDHTLSGPGRLLRMHGTPTPEFTYLDVEIEINNLKFTNSASAANPAVEVGASAKVAINGSTFHDITAATRGAALVQLPDANSLTIKNSIFRDNTSSGSTQGGGALWLQGTTPISNSKFTDNEAEHSGGAIYAAPAAVVTIRGSSFSGNESDGDGGAYFGGGNTSIYRSAFSENEAGDQGGAIFYERNELRVENSTFYANTSANEGGALYVSATDTPTANVRHVTFVNNEASEANGASKNGNALFAATAATANMYNSIIVEKSSAGGNSCQGLDANTKNIIQDGHTSCATDSDLGTDPKLGGRAGSPAYYTLRAGSPAIDEADDTQCGYLEGDNDVDQRGAVRPYGDDCDIGAYEWYPSPPEEKAEAPRRRRSVATPTVEPGCAYCAELEAAGFRLRATYGLASGVQFRRLDAGGIGDRAVLESGFRDAVDVFGYAEQGVEVCFPGTGSLLLLGRGHQPARGESAAGLLARWQDLRRARSRRHDRADHGSARAHGSAAGDTGVGSESEQLHGDDESHRQLPGDAGRGLTAVCGSLGECQPGLAALRCPADGAGADSGLGSGWIITARRAG